MKAFQLFMIAVVVVGISFAIRNGLHMRTEKQQFEQERAWKMQLVNEINAATADMYKCADEIHSTLDKNPPACQKACLEYYAFMLKERKPPSFIAEVPVYHDKNAGANDDVCQGRLADDKF